jgi:multiple sugar transport system substrate-binding protein
MEINRINRRDFLRMAGAGAAVLAVAACGPSSPAPQADTGEAGGAAAPSAAKTVLRMQVNPEQEQPVVDMYREINPDVDFEFVSVTGIDHEEIAAKIMTLVASGQTLDLGYAATEATQLYAGQKLSAPIDEYVKRDAADLKEYFADVHPSLIQAMMWEGSLYQLPIDFNAANMYYNTAVLQEAGVEAPTTDWTKDDFYNIAKAATKKDASGATTTYGYAWTNRLWGGWMPWIFVNGSNLLTEEAAPGGEWLWSEFYADEPAAQGRGGGWRWTAPNANDAANVEALEFMVQLFEEGITPAVELGGGDTLQGFFTTGKLAMTPAGGFWAGGLNNAGMENGSFDVQLMPNWKNQRHQFGTAGQWLFAQGKQLDAAWDYMKFRMSKDAMAANGMFNPVTLTTPTRRSMLTAERFASTGPANWQVFYATLDDHPDTAPIPAPPVSNPMTALFVGYTSRAMNGELTPQAALDGMQKELEDLFARNPDMYKKAS